MVKDVTVKNHKDLGLGFWPETLRFEIRAASPRFEGRWSWIWVEGSLGMVWCDFGPVWTK